MAAREGSLMAALPLFLEEGFLPGQHREIRCVGLVDGVMSVVQDIRNTHRKQRDFHPRTLVFIAGEVDLGRGVVLTQVDPPEPPSRWANAVLNRG